MQKLLTRSSVLAGALVFGACQDAAGPVALAGSGGSGNDTECVGPLTGTFDNVIVPPNSFCVLLTATVKGNVLVMPNSFLQVNASTVNGNLNGLENSALDIRTSTVGGSVKVFESRLLILSTIVRGDVAADKARDILFYSFTAPRNRVLGSIHITESTGEASVELCGTDLPEGNIEIQKWREIYVIVGGPSCALAGGGNNLLKGNLKVEESEISEFALLSISDNIVGGNLQVFKNRGLGAKFVQNNTVRGSLQCFENSPPFIGGPNSANKAEGQCFGAAPAI